MSASPGAGGWSMNEGPARSPSPRAEQRRPDLVLRHGTLADGTHADIAVRNGRIARISPQIDTAGAVVEDLDGQLVLPSFVDLHMHLDKAFTLELTCKESGTLDEARMRFGEVRLRLTRESYVERALRTLRLCAAAGTTAVRTHVNLYATPIGVQPIEALVEVRERVRDWIDMQIVPFPAGNIAHDHALREACKEALHLGADAVGGGPALDGDPAGLIAATFALATRFDRDVDLHVDETDDPRVCTLASVADATIAYDYQGRVTVGHCCSLAAMDDASAARLIERVAAARLTVVTLPSCNLYLQGRHDRHPIRRGLTRVKELAAAGVNLAAASDNIRDPFNPFGRGDLLQIADLLAHAAHLGSLAEQALARDAIAANPRACMTHTDPATLRGGMLCEGDAADLVVCATAGAADLIAAQPARSLVLSRGHTVARTRVITDMAF